MKIEIEVHMSFINQCLERAKKYKAGKRSPEQLYRDIECELYEWYMIDSSQALDYPTWEVDMTTEKHGNVDVKMIDKWYNITCTKLTHIMKQRRKVKHFVFVEWIDRLDRPMVPGDKVFVNVIGAVKYNDVLDNLRASQYNGFYFDARKFLGKKK